MGYYISSLCGILVHHRVTPSPPLPSTRAPSPSLIICLGACGEECYESKVSCLRPNQCTVYIKFTIAFMAEDTSTHWVAIFSVADLSLMHAQEYA